MHADASRARAELHWEPTVSLEEGLGRTIDWYKRELGREQSSFTV
jgi:nucleoside-diphosphate-sugar epimerase